MDNGMADEIKALGPLSPSDGCKLSRLAETNCKLASGDSS